MLNLIRTKCNETYEVHNPTGLKLLIHLRLGLSHLNDHKFNHNFRDYINSLCSCCLSVENNVHSFLHCHHFSLQRQTLMSNIKSVDKDIINATDSDLVNILLFGSSKYQYHINSKYSVFQLILFSRQKGSPVNYFENWTMSLTQIYELIFNYFSF